MKTLLVIASQSPLVSAIRSVLDPALYRIVQPDGPGSEALLAMLPNSDAVIMDADLTTVGPIRTLDLLHHSAPNLPVMIYASASQWEWEEEAYLRGVNHILSKPVRARVLNTLLNRLLTQAKPAGCPRLHEIRSNSGPRLAGDSGDLTVKMLELLHSCSSILSHSLCAESLLREFLLLLREIVGVNRAAIFLRQPPGSLALGASLESEHRLHAACASGLAPGLLQHFELSFESGIGAHVFRTGRIVRRASEEVENDVQMLKEFELLGAEVAIPIMDRQSFLGLAVFDGRLTGGPMNNEELTLIFHLLEQLGMTIRNIWLHNQISASHDMLESILRQIKSACIVVAADLSLLHVNEAARRWFSLVGRGAAVHEFSSLPHPVGSKVFEVLKTGNAIIGLKYKDAHNPQSTFHLAITPFQKSDSTTPNAALLTIDDYSHMERIQKLEIEASNLQIVKQMAQQLAHEIGNAMVPISTYQQLLKERFNGVSLGDVDSLSGAVDAGVERVIRLARQMRFLARDHVEGLDSILLKELAESAFRDALKQCPSDKASLHWELEAGDLALVGDRAALQYAFFEIFLNALQSGAASAPLVVRARQEFPSDGSLWATIEMEMAGVGFNSSASSGTAKPQAAARPPGMGLGLAVSAAIFQSHQGRQEITDSASGKGGLIRISLPLPSSKPSNGSSNGHAFH